MFDKIYEAHREVQESILEKVHKPVLLKDFPPVSLRRQPVHGAHAIREAWAIIESLPEEEIHIFGANVNFQPPEYKWVVDKKGKKMRILKLKPNA